MKKLLFITLAFVTILSFAACKATDSGSNSGNQTGGNQTGEDNKDDDQADKDQDDDQTGDNQSGDNQNGDSQTDEGKAGNLDGSLEDILAKIYETADVDDNFKEYIKSGLYNDPVTAEREEYYLGKAGLEFEEALASEPMIQPGAYSLVLVRAKDGADVEQLKTDIKENVDPAKWICVGVQEENIIVDNIGDLVFLVMSDDQAKPLHDAFLALK